MSIKENGDLLTDATLLVILDDNTRFFLLISVEEDGVNRFLSELNSRMR